MHLTHHPISERMAGFPGNTRHESLGGHACGKREADGLKSPFVIVRYVHLLCRPSRRLYFQGETLSACALPCGNDAPNNSNTLRLVGISCRNKKPATIRAVPASGLP